MALNATPVNYLAHVDYSDIESDLNEFASYFETARKSDFLSVDLDSDADASRFRRQLAAYASDNRLVRKLKRTVSDSNVTFRFDTPKDAA